MRRLLLIAILGLTNSATASFAQSGVEISNLPAGARLYVNGIPGTLRQNRILLPAGKVTIQIEKRANNSLMAARHTLEIGRNQIVVLTPELLLVKIPQYPVFPEGPPGPAGPPGPPGMAFTAPEPNDDLKTLSRPLQAALRTLLEELSDTANALQHTARRNSLWRYWRYDPGNIFPPGPLGPSGPCGEEGLLPLPGETTLLVTEKGRLVLAEIEERLKLPQLRAHLTALEKRSDELLFSPFAFGQMPAIQLLTPEWGVLCDKEYQTNIVEYQRDKNHTLCPPGAMGAPGRRGPRGTGYPAGSPTQKVVLPEKRIQELLDHFVKDNKPLQEWVAQIEKTLQSADRLLPVNPK